MNEQQLLVALQQAQEMGDTEAVADLTQQLADLEAAAPATPRGKPLDSFIKFSRILDSRGMKLCKDLEMLPAGDDGSNDIFLKEGTNMKSLVKDIEMVREQVSSDDEGNPVMDTHLKITRADGSVTTKKADGVEELISQLTEPQDGEVNSIPELIREVQELGLAITEAFAQEEIARIADVEALETSFHLYAQDMRQALMDIEASLREMASARDLTIATSFDFTMSYFSWRVIDRISYGRGVAQIPFSDLASYGRVEVILNFDEPFAKDIPASYRDIKNWMVRTAIISADGQELSNAIVWSKAYVEDYKLLVHVKAEDCDDLHEGESVQVTAVYTGEYELPNLTFAPQLPDYNCDGTSLKPTDDTDAWDPDVDAVSPISLTEPTAECCPAYEVEAVIGPLRQQHAGIEFLQEVINQAGPGSLFQEERQMTLEELTEKLGHELMMGLVQLVCECPELLDAANEALAEFPALALPPIVLGTEEGQVNCEDLQTPHGGEDHSESESESDYGYGGCIDPAATNYDPSAGYDDGSCDYPALAYEGVGETVSAFVHSADSTDPYTGNGTDIEILQSGIGVGEFAPASGIGNWVGRMQLSDAHLNSDGEILFAVSDTYGDAWAGNGFVVQLVGQDNVVKQVVLMPDDLESTDPFALQNPYDVDGDGQTGDVILFSGAETTDYIRVLLDNTQGDAWFSEMRLYVRPKPFALTGTLVYDNTVAGNEKLWFTLDDESHAMMEALQAGLDEDPVRNTWLTFYNETFPLGYQNANGNGNPDANHVGYINRDPMDMPNLWYMGASDFSSNDGISTLATFEAAFGSEAPGAHEAGSFEMTESTSNGDAGYEILSDAGLI